MVIITTNKGEKYKIDFRRMYVENDGQQYNLIGVFRMCKGLDFESLVYKNKGQNFALASKGKIIDITEE